MDHLSSVTQLKCFPFSILCVDVICLVHVLGIYLYLELPAKDIQTTKYT